MRKTSIGEPLKSLPANPILGNLLDFRQNRLPFLLSLPQYGDITPIRLGRESVYVIHHPDFVQQVLGDQVDKFQKLRLTRNMFQRVIKSDVSLRQTEAWKQRRAAVQGALHAQKIEQYAAAMVDLTRGQMALWHTPFDVYQEMRQLTLLIAAQTLFGTDISPLVQAVMQATRVLQEHGSRRFNTLFSLPLWMPLKSTARVREAIATLDRVAQGMIDECLESDAPRSDLVTMLLDIQPLALQNVREELVSLLMSGHETTATALTWVWYLLGRHPQVQTRITAEIDAVLQGNPATVSMIPQLRYTQAVIKEALRLYPPSWVISRKAVEDVTIGECRIPRSATVFISPYSLHRDARWFEQSEAFCPERFLGGEINRFTYLPFGTGARKCIGSSFANMEIMLLLVTIIQGFRLVPLWRETIEPEALITLRPRQPLIVIPVGRGGS
jgi:cytochrome P450